MPCLLVILVLMFPRVILVLMFLLSNYLWRAYHGYLIPLLGFIFLPITTIVYAWMVNNGYSIAGINALYLVIAVILDLGSHGAGWRSRNR